jgi:hypothetical protein
VNGYGSSGGESTFLPDIKNRVISKSSNRTQQTTSTEISGLRKASPEAIALMMKNINSNKSKGKVWVPSGVPNKKDAKMNA